MTIALISDEGDRLFRDFTKPERRQTIYGRCVFCGHLCFGRVCRAHRDLLDVEAEPDARHREVSAPGSDKEGR